MADSVKTLLRHKILLPIFGILLAFLILELSLQIGGYIFLSCQEYKNNASLSKKHSYRIMCIGESTTAIGGNDSCPSQLERILNEHSIGRKFSVINKGVIATTTTNVLLELENNLNKYKPDMVICMMGINDMVDYIDRGISDKIPLKSIYLLRSYRLLRILQTYISTPVKSKKTNINDNHPYVDLGWLYLKRNNYTATEKLFKKALEIDPQEDRAYSLLGFCYKKQGEYIQAERAFNKAIEINPWNFVGYYGLASVDKAGYSRFLRTEELFNKGIEIKPFPPQTWISYFSLGQFYLDRNKLAQAEKICKKALGFNHREDRLYGLLATVYMQEGNYELAKEYYQMANKIRLKYYNPVTRYNYLQVEKRLSKRGIKMVCVQYPMRSVDSLKAIFIGQTGIVFVDNEKVFKDAVKQSGYNEYFTDVFGGDFGHCTKKGNRLLAENIVNVILKKYFNQ